MPNRWFQLRETGTGTEQDPYRPEYVQEMGLDFTGNKTAPNGAPWVVRVYGTQTELDELANKPGVTEKSSVPTETLNKMLAQDRNADGWKQSFQIG